MKYIYLLQEIIIAMNDRIMASCCLDFQFYFFLNLALPVFANFYFKVVRFAFECYLYVGNAFRRTGLAPHLQTAIVLALTVLSLVKRPMYLSPCLNTPG